MGATVTTGKKVAVFRPDDGGDQVFVLFEERYEQNVTPHRPLWAVRAVGRIREVMAHIFEMASGCEDGMIVGRSGHLSPERYIQGWLRELRQPLAMPEVCRVLLDARNRPVQEFPTGIGLSDRLRGEPLWCQDMKHVEQILTDPEATGQFCKTSPSGHHPRQILRSIQGHGYVASLHRDPDLVMALFPERPWMFFDHLPGAYCETLPQSPADLVYHPEPREDAQAKVPTFYRFPLADFAVLAGDGGGGETRLHSTGWPCRPVERFIESYADRELRYPGSFSHAIRNFRCALDEAKTLPGETTITCRLPCRDNPPWTSCVGNAQRLDAALKTAGIPVERTSDGGLITRFAIKDLSRKVTGDEYRAAVYDLMTFFAASQGNDLVEWRLPDESHRHRKKPGAGG